VIPVEVDLEIEQGATFERTLRWECAPIVYRPITAATQTAPCRLTVPQHGVPDDWRVAITGIKGMVQLNARNRVLRASDYFNATVIDADTIELNEVDAQGFGAYVGGGTLQYMTPHDLAGYTARMQIRAAIGASDVLLELTTENGRIAIDDAAKRIDLVVAAADTAAITWAGAVYDLELVSPGGEVLRPIFGKVTVSDEVTR
jgi:hypothetical protein